MEVAYTPVATVINTFPDRLEDLEFLVQSEMYERLLKETKNELTEEQQFLADYALLIYL